MTDAQKEVSLATLQHNPSFRDFGNDITIRYHFTFLAGYCLPSHVEHSDSRFTGDDPL
jgi:hypothetical protein